MGNTQQTGSAKSFGVSAYGLEGISDVEADKIVGNALQKIANTAKQGGTASAKFIGALKAEEDVTIFVTQESCVAFSNPITDIISINPAVSSLYRKYPSEEFKGEIENFDAILVHEITHKLSKLDFPENVSDAEVNFKGKTTWNTPKWKEDSPPADAKAFAKGVAVDMGVGGAIRYYLIPGGKEGLREYGKEELRAIRAANSVMSEVQDDYHPRRYYSDSRGIARPGCELSDGQHVPMQDGSIVKELNFMIRHSPTYILERLEEIKQKLRDLNQGKKTSEDTSSVDELRKVSANDLLEVATDDSVRLETAQAMIRARISENLAKNDKEAYYVERVEHQNSSEI